MGLLKMEFTTKSGTVNTSNKSVKALREQMNEKMLDVTVNGLEEFDVQASVRGTIQIPIAENENGDILSIEYAPKFTLKAPDQENPKRTRNANSTPKEETEIPQLFK